MGFSGLSRITNPEYEKFFRWELRAIKRVQQEGYPVAIKLTGTRTLEELDKALTVINQEGLESSKVGVEISGPANVLLIEEYLKRKVSFLSLNEEKLAQYILAADLGTQRELVPQREIVQTIKKPRQIVESAAARYRVPLAVDVFGIPWAASIEIRDLLVSYAMRPQRKAQALKELAKRDFELVKKVFQESFQEESNPRLLDGVTEAIIALYLKSLPEGKRVTARQISQGTNVTEKEIARFVDRIIEAFPGEIVVKTTEPQVYIRAFPKPGAASPSEFKVETGQLVVGVPKEIKPQEARVGLTPKGVQTLAQQGIKVIVQEGAGQKSGFSDQDYIQAGALIVPKAEDLYRQANLIKKVKEPLPEEFPLIRSDHIIFTYLHLASDKKLTEFLINSGATGLAYETVEKEGKTPLLEPMSKVAGILAAYQGAIYANRLQHKKEEIISQFPDVPSGLRLDKVVVLGGGTAGRNAAEMSARMGASVVITEINPARRQELKRYFEENNLKVEVLEPNSDKEALFKAQKEASVIIGAVYVPGQKAPIVLDEETLSKLGSGKVIVDIAIDQGGSVAGSRPTTHESPVFRDKFGNLRYCVANMPAAAPRVASQLLEEATIDYTLALAKDYKEAFKRYPELLGGINTSGGKLFNEGVAKAHNLPLERISPQEAFYPSSYLYLSQMASQDIQGKTFLVRADFNVPTDKKTGKITDDARIRASLETINYIRARGGKVVLFSHFGRPSPGKPDEGSRLNKVSERLSQLLGIKVTKLDGYIDEAGTFRLIGENERKAVKAAQSGDVILLENTRIDPREQSKDAKEKEQLAKEIASLGDVFILDGFGVAHRGKDASVGVVPKFKLGLKGLLVENEERGLEPALKPEHPFVVIFGGAKISDKVPVIDALLDKMKAQDKILIGGGMAYSFLKSRGLNIGNSLSTPEDVKLAGEILERARAEGIEVLLPVDHIVTREFNVSSQPRTTQQADIPEGWMGLDIGPRTQELFKQALSRAKTVLWNGPLGAFDLVGAKAERPFAKGTFEVARFLSRLTQEGKLKSIVGGGDTASAVELVGVKDRLSFVSTGGGATLEYIQNDGELSGFANLKRTIAGAAPQDHRKIDFISPGQSGPNLVQGMIMDINSRVNRIQKFLDGLALGSSFKRAFILLSDAPYAPIYISGILQSRLGKDIAEIVVLTEDDDFVIRGKDSLNDFLNQIKTGDLTSLPQQLQDIYREAVQRAPLMLKEDKVSFVTQAEGQFDFAFSPSQETPEDLEKIKIVLSEGGIFVDHTNRVFRKQNGELVNLDSGKTGIASTGDVPEAEGKEIAAVRRPTVLLVDDNQEFRDRLARHLLQEGYDVLQVSNPDEAMELIKNPQQPIDVVVHDVEFSHPGTPRRATQFIRRYMLQRDVRSHIRIIAEEFTEAVRRLQDLSYEYRGGRIPLVAVSGDISLVDEKARQSLGYDVDTYMSKRSLSRILSQIKHLAPSDISGGSPAACLKGLYDNPDLRESPVTVKDLIPLREGYSETTVRVELDNLIALGLMEKDTSQRPYRYYLTDILRRAPPETIDAICALPQLNRYQIPPSELPSLKDSIDDILLNSLFTCYKIGDDGHLSETRDYGSLAEGKTGLSKSGKKTFAKIGVNRIIVARLEPGLNIVAPGYRDCAGIAIKDNERIIVVHSLHSLIRKVWPEILRLTQKQGSWGKQAILLGLQEDIKWMEDNLPAEIKIIGRKVNTDPGRPQELFITPEAATITRSIKGPSGTDLIISRDEFKFAPLHEGIVHKEKLEKALVKDYRAIAVDFDGTLFYEGMPHQEYAEIIEALVDILKSGRNLAVVTSARAEYVQELLISRLRNHPRITKEDFSRTDVYHSGGAAGYNAGRGKVYYEIYFPDKLRRQLARLLRGGREVIFDEESWQNYFNQTKYQGSLDVGDNCRISFTKYKVTLGSFKDPKLIPQYQRALKELFLRYNLNLDVKASSVAVEIIPNEVNKALAVTDIARRLGIKTSEIAKIGDRGDLEGNDREFLKEEGSFSVDKYDPANPNQICISLVNGLQGPKATLWLLRQLIKGSEDKRVEAKFTLKPDGAVILEYGGQRIEVGNANQERSIFGKGIRNWLKTKGFLSDYGNFTDEEKDRKIRISNALRRKVNRDIRNRKGLQQIKAEIARYHNWAGLNLPAAWGRMNSAMYVHYPLSKLIDWYAQEQVALFKLFARKSPPKGKSFIEWVEDLSFWDLPVWPLTESGQVDTSLIDWFNKENMRAPPAYFKAKKVSLRKLLVDKDNNNKPIFPRQLPLFLALIFLPLFAFLVGVLGPGLGLPLEDPELIAAGLGFPFLASLNLNKQEDKFLDQVYRIAEQEYKGKSFAWGQTYLAHVLATLEKLKEFQPNVDDLTSAACLLHEISPERIEKLLRKSGRITKQQAGKISALVERANRASRLPYLPPARGNYTIQNQMNAVIQLAQEPEALLLVFADKLQTLQEATENTREYLTREIAQVYVPLAERLGLYGLASRLRDEHFRVSQPQKYEEIKSEIEAVLKMDYPQALRHLENIKQNITFELAKLGIKADVEVRVKKPYSVYEKLNSQGIRLKELGDLFGIRLIFESEEDLWRSTAIAYIFGQPIEGQTELKRTETIGYEAFHVNVRDAQGRPFEFQFMTRENYAAYKYGASAHWAYKLRRLTGQNFDIDHLKLTGDFRKDFTSLHKSLSKWVVVFKQEYESQGRLALRPLRLRAGAIPADFAAAREVNQFNKDYRGALSFMAGYDMTEGNLVFSPKRMRSDRYHLKPGEVLEVLTKENFLLTSNSAARTIRENSRKIRTLVLLENLTAAKRLESIEKGRAVLEKAGFGLNANGKDTYFLSFLANRLGLRDIDELCAAIGSTDKVSIQELKAYRKGRQLLEEKGFNFLTNKVALERLRSIFAQLGVDSLEELLKSLGEGRISIKEVYERLSKKEVDVSISPQFVSKEGGGTYRLTLTCQDRRGLVAQVSSI
jgi:phosphoglycerate kinase